MKLSTMTVFLIATLSLAVIAAASAGAQCVPFWGTGFGVPFATGVGTGFVSSFQTASSFTTTGVGGFGFGIPFWGTGFGVPLGLGTCGLGFGGCGFGSSLGFC